VPPGVVTVTSTVPPAGSAGMVAVSEPSAVTVTAVAGVVPKATVAGPNEKPDPVTVTVAPPPSTPATGAMAVTAGAAS